ncbi:MAG: hypothetical protein KJ645_14335, partial [Planctomycetes bacterium]|nr:hypothetical protein [Planctomycetota bacterium]
MRRIKTLLILLFLLLAPQSYVRGAEELNAILEKLYASPLEAQGEAALHLEELKKLFKENLRSPAAPVILHRMNDLLPECADPTLLDDFYADLAQLGREKGIPNGLLATDALIRHRNILLQRGKYEEAEALHAFESFAGKILAIGPFGFRTSSLHDVVFPPEKPLEGLRSCEGYAGPVDWKLIERDPREEGFDLFNDLYPETGACYALYPFRLLQAKGLLVTLSTAASIKVWYNGELVEDIDHRKAHLPGLHKLALAGTEGWNRILIKFSDARPVFSLKITDRTGYPVPGLVEIKEKTLEPMAPGVQGKVSEIDLGGLDMLAFMTSHSSLHPDDVFAAVAHADLLWTRGFPSQAISEAERALELAPENPHVLNFLGGLYWKA